LPTSGPAFWDYLASVVLLLGGIDRKFPSIHWFSSLVIFWMVSRWFPATILAAAGNKLMSDVQRIRLTLPTNKSSVVFVGASISLDRRMRNSQALFTILRENPLNRVPNEVRPGA
jgi:hypothetical protein